MKRFVLGACLVLALATFAWGTTYGNLDASTAVDNGGSGAVGWGSCVDCAGGGSTASIASSPFQTKPSRDGASRDFYLSGAAYTNALWWYKVGPNRSAKNFRFDFWVYLDSGTQSAQALEFDAFQFISGRQYMFGTQCNYAAGVWDLWNMGTHRWVHTTLACSSLKVSTWYHMIWTFHRTTPDNLEHYDSLTMVQYNSNGSVASNRTYNLNLAYPSGPTPVGWTDNLGVQFQMDIGAKGATMQEWVDLVTLAAW
jgi:hypothetical protein